ncbi:unnamed protein product [Pedinophyceae sp. YPF-701]|nr:unnamed protein product [Pedinophyceae sp. YPF-701]
MAATFEQWSAQFSAQVNFKVCNAAERLFANDEGCRIYLADKKLTDGDVRGVAAALQCNNTLTNLDMGGASFGRPGAQALADALRSNTSLRELHLRYTETLADGAIPLAEALRGGGAPMLEVLNLTGCGLDGETACVVGECLAGCKHVVEVSLSQNEGCGDGAAAGIAAGIAAGATPRRVNVHSCGMTDKGLGLLADALRRDTHMEQLNLSSNKFSDVGAEALAEALRANTTLRRVMLVNSPGIGQRGWAALQAAVEARGGALEVIDA